MNEVIMNMIPGTDEDDMLNTMESALRRMLYLGRVFRESHCELILLDLGRACKYVLGPHSEWTLDIDGEKMTIHKYAGGYECEGVRTYHWLTNSGEKCEPRKVPGSIVECNHCSYNWCTIR